MSERGAASGSQVSPSAAASVQFVLALGSALHGYGCPAYRVEDAMALAARRCGVDGQFFSTPTAIFAQFGGEDGRAILLRRQERGTDLTRLARLYELLDEVVEGRLDVVQGTHWIAAVLGAEPAYRPYAAILGHGVAAAAAAVFLGGGLGELVAAGSAGLAIGALGAFSANRLHLSRALELVAGLLAMVLIGLFSVLFGPVAALIAAIASLVVLLPGYTFTTALAEIASRHLASGTARLMGAIVVFLELAVGVGLGRAIVARLQLPELASVPQPLPEPLRWLAVVIASLALVPLLQIPRVDLFWVVLTSLAGFACLVAGHELLGPPLGAFFGALVIVLIANLYGRLRRRPTALISTPAILLLVPGTLGVRSLTALLADDVMTGVQFAFGTLIAASALVAGILFANVLVPPRREA